MNQPVGLGAAIKTLRDPRGCTQGQLSLYSQVNQSYLSPIKRGKHDQKVSATIIAALAEALGATALQRPFHCSTNSRVMRRYKSPYISLGSMWVCSHHSFHVVMKIQSGSLWSAASNVEL